MIHPRVFPMRLFEPKPFYMVTERVWAALRGKPPIKIVIICAPVVALHNCGDRSPTTMSDADLARIMRALDSGGFTVQCMDAATTKVSFEEV